MKWKRRQEREGGRGGGRGEIGGGGGKGGGYAVAEKLHKDNHDSLAFHFPGKLNARQ